MPPRITYNTTGATAGTEINFTFHAEEIMPKLITSSNRNVSDNGNWETIRRFTEKELIVKYNLVTQAERDSYETFFTAWANQGKLFLFWPTAANNSTYFTVKLKDKDWSPKTIALSIHDRYEWTHTYRRTV